MLQLQFAIQIKFLTQYFTQCETIINPIERVWVAGKRGKRKKVKASCKSNLIETNFPRQIFFNGNGEVSIMSYHVVLIANLCLKIK